MTEQDNTLEITQAETLEIEQTDVLEEEQTDVLEEEQAVIHETQTALVETVPAERHESIGTRKAAAKQEAQAAPVEFFAGSDVGMKVKVSCPSGCDLRGDIVEITAHDAVVQQIELAIFEEGVNWTEEFIIQAPMEPGKYTWKAVYTAKKKEVDTEEAAAEGGIVAAAEEVTEEGDLEGAQALAEETATEEAVAEAVEETTGDAAEETATKALADVVDEAAVIESAEALAEEGAEEVVAEIAQHTPSTATFSFTVSSHVVKLFCWGVPFPAVMGSKFALKVGARCTAGCKLAGETVSVYDQSGVEVATGVLGEEVWKDTTAMYWAGLEVQAPAEEGFYKWSATCSRPELERSHEMEDTTFAFRTARPPEHTVSVEIVERDKKKPVLTAAVIISAQKTTYRAYPDATGVASIQVPKGDYDVTVIAPDHKTWDGKVSVDADVSIKVYLMYHPD